MTFISVNPHNPDDVIGEWEAAGDGEAAVAVDRARAAAKTWRRTPAAERSAALGRAAAAMEQRAGEITALTVREVGKPVSEARAEVSRGISILKWAPSGNRPGLAAGVGSGVIPCPARSSAPVMPCRPSGVPARVFTIVRRTGLWQTRTAR